MIDKRMNQLCKELNDLADRVIKTGYRDISRGFTEDDKHYIFEEDGFRYFLIDYKLFKSLLIAKPTDGMKLIPVGIYDFDDSKIYKYESDTQILAMVEEMFGGQE